MTLLAGLVFSSIGGVFLFYGKRTYNTVYIVCGAILLLASYLIDNALALTVAGVIVTAVPYLYSRGFG